METNNFKPPKSLEKVDINLDDVIPKGDKIDPLIFTSNNQVYKKKEEIQYAKKSHLEFIKKMSQNKDPINVHAQGGLKPYTYEDVAKHNSEGSLWTVLEGKVYDLTIYLDYHPGGSKKLLLGAGKDCTDLFNEYHPWVNINHLISKLQIGYII